MAACLHGRLPEPPGSEPGTVTRNPTEVPSTGGPVAHPEPCLAAAFTAGIADVAPLPARLYLGAPNDRSPLAAGPLLTVAGGVAAVAIVATAVLSNRVLRPVRSLTDAARRLGLAIAKQIVTDHGGTIGVSSELGVGATFTITLPATVDPAGARSDDGSRRGA